MTEDIKVKIEAAKKNGCTVMAIKLGNIKFTYRSLNRLEWRETQKDIDELVPKDNARVVGLKEIGEDLIVQRFTLDPVLDKASILGIPAGSISKLAELILQASGFGDLEAEPEKL
jgi:predicted S18 family serine protease